MPKADAQTRQPDQLVQPVLLPSTTRSIASKAWAWFFVIASIFLLFPVALVISLFLLISSFNQSVSEEFFAMLKVSAFRATMISGYFVLFFVTWGTSFFFRMRTRHWHAKCSLILISQPPPYMAHCWMVFPAVSIPPRPYNIYHTCVLITCDASSGVTVSSRSSLLHHLGTLSQCVRISILLSYII